MRSTRTTVVTALAGALITLLTATACATLSDVLGVEPPRLQHASERESTLRLRLPSIQHPSGAVTVRLWARVENPNGFGLTLSTFRGTLDLEDRQVADVDLPLGLPLQAGRDTVIPLEITFGRSAFDALGDVGRALLNRGTLTYELGGTIGVDAGPFGEPRFGPRSWLRGELDVETGLR